MEISDRFLYSVLGDTNDEAPKYIYLVPVSVKFEI